MKRLLFILLLLCGAVSAQTYYTDCAGIAGTSLSGTVTCPNLPAGITSAFTPTVGTVPHVFPVQGSANVFNVTAGLACCGAGSLQAQINAAAAACGSTGALVVVPSGNTYTISTSFILPPTNCDATHWVVIESDHLSSLPSQGTRISASAANMPTLGTSNPINYPVIMAEDNPATPLNAAGSACTATGGGASTVPCGYWLAGLDVEDDPPNSSQNQLALVVLGDYCNQLSCSITSGMTAANLASRFVIDRCWIHPTQATSNILHGIRYTASYFAIEDSIVEAHFTWIGNTGQTTGISSDFTMGPVDIGNNEIMAVTENILFGGTGPKITNSTPSDIYIHQNYIHKRTAWLDAGGANYFQPKMRNWIECKNCQRLLAEGNVFDTDDGNSVSGGWQFTPRNGSTPGDNGCTWCVVQDVVIRYNKASNLSDLTEIIGANGASHGSQGPELPSKRISEHDNVIENINSNTFSGGNGRTVQLFTETAQSADCSGTAGTAQCQMSDIIFTHNTIAGADGVGNGVRTVVTLGNTGSGSASASSDKGFNLVMTNNIMPAGSFFQANDAGTSPSPVINIFNNYWSSTTFDRNVITGLVAAGLTTSEFASPTCNFSGTSGCTGVNAEGWQTTMSGVNFVNYASGSGGDYHLCITSSVPSGCSAQSVYEDTATDSFADNTKEGPSPGANIDAVNQMTAGVTTGTYTIQPAIQYGPVQGQHLEMRQWAVFPGYFDVAASDGSGKADFSGNNNSNSDSESYSGLFPFHDLQHDPGKLMNLSGANVGLSDHDYHQSVVSQPCGGGTGISDSKAYYGQVTVLESNNVRVGFQYLGPVVITNTHAPVTSPPTNLMWRYKWYVYRPGKIYERYSWDNNCGGTFTFGESGGGPFESVISSSVYPFDQIPGALQYPPSYGVGWADSIWQTNPCHGNTSSYDSCTGYPWGFIDNSGNTPGLLFHSITSSQSQGDSMSVGITPGYTNPYGNTSLHYPVTAEFAKIEHENATNYACCEYRASVAGGGLRSALHTFSAPADKIPPNGTDSYLTHALVLAGDLGVRNITNLQAYQTEYNSPPSPTVNAGSGVSFNYDDGSWNATASGTPSLDITATGTMTSPAFLISGWNNTVPNVSVGGVAQTANVGFVYANTDATHLLVQLVNLPSAGNGGMKTISSSTRVIITAGSLPSNNGGVQRLGTTYLKGTTVIH